MKRMILVVGLLLVGVFGAACSPCNYESAFPHAGQFIDYKDCSGSTVNPVCQQVTITCEHNRYSVGPIQVRSSAGECTSGAGGGTGGGGGGGGSTPGLICPPAWYGPSNCMTLDQFIDGFGGSY